MFFVCICYANHETGRNGRISLGQLRLPAYRATANNGLPLGRRAHHATATARAPNTGRSPPSTQLAPAPSPGPHGRILKSPDGQRQTTLFQQTVSQRVPQGSLLYDLSASLIVRTGKQVNSFLNIHESLSAKLAADACTHSR